MNSNIKKISKLTVLAVIFVLGFPQKTKASNFSLTDFNFNLYLGTTLITNNVLASVWGTWNSGTSTFTPNQTVYANGGFGYVDTTVGAPEINIMINRVDQTQYASGTLLALAVYNRPDLSDWDSSAQKVVLTDISWTAPAWSLVGNDKDVTFTANTTAVVGSFNYNGGNEQITLVPEPSTGALMALGAVGMIALRRLRKV